MGIPFDFTAKPVIAPPQKPRVTVHVKAVRPDRDELEITFPRVVGYRGEEAKEKKTTTEEYWIKGVNNNGQFGRWAFSEFTDIYMMESEFKDKVVSQFNAMIDTFLVPLSN